MPGLIAMTREVSPAMARCQLTHLPRLPIDVATAARQHGEYERALAALGCTVVRLPSGPDLPDCVFVEDTAVVLDEIAIVMRPGAVSRRPETTLVADALRLRRPLGRIESPGTMDGGDVLAIGRSIFVGRSSRTNADAIEQLGRLVAPFGYAVCEVEVRGALHLKSAVTAVSADTVLMNPGWVPLEPFRRFDRIDVDPGEAPAANIVHTEGGLLYSAVFPRTLDRLAVRGFSVTTVDVSELAKAEGAVTCCSLIFPDKT
jgi:dimethylargininase